VTGEGESMAEIVASAARMRGSTTPNRDPKEEGKESD